MTAISTSGAAKSQCILSPHFETLPFGSMNIVLDNSRTSVRSDATVSGKIKIFLEQPIDVKAITMNLCGFTRSDFTTQTADASSAIGQRMRLAKTAIDCNFTIADFGTGKQLLG